MSVLARYSVLMVLGVMQGCLAQGSIIGSSAELFRQDLDGTNSNNYYSNEIPSWESDWSSYQGNGASLEDETASFESESGAVEPKMFWGLIGNKQKSQLKRTYKSKLERFILAVAKPFRHKEGVDREAHRAHAGPLKKFFSKLMGPINKLLLKPTKRIVFGTFSELLGFFGDRIQAIYPGTEWCGAGNNAGSSNEVGFFHRTDSCCREHDMCKTTIDTGDAKYGLLNDGIFTRSHCNCDLKFFHCLKNASSVTSENIGLTYFNFLRPQCYKLEHPSKCTAYDERRWWWNKKCVRYALDLSGGKSYQWFDNPDF